MSAQHKSLVATLPEYHVDDDTRETSYYTDTGVYGVMEPGTFDDPVEQVREMYGDHPDMFGKENTVVDGQNRRSLHGHTQWAQTRDEALEMVSTIPDYNCYSPKYVRRAVEQFPGDAFVAAGREGSVVIYIWTDQAETVGSILDDIRPDPEDVEETDKFFSAGPPNEIGAIVDAEYYPGQGIGESVSDVGDGPQALVRAWWD